MRRSSSDFSVPLFAIILAGIVWGLLSFYFSIVFGLPVPGREVPQWYVILGYVFDGGARLGGVWLCFRNWRLPTIISDRNIWLFFGIRSGLYFIGSLLFGYWELVLNRYPDVSLADPFFIVSALFLLWGMLLAVKSRQVRLQVWQWGAIVIITAFGIWLGWLSSFPPDNSQAIVSASLKIESDSLFAAINDTLQKEAPGWVLAVEKMLDPLAGVISLLYVIVDIFLLVLAGALLLTFWGGRFSRTWTIIALSALLNYIADIRYAYIITRGNFESGGLLDSFWVLSAILLAIGAALEYDVSSRPRFSRH